MIFKYLHRFSFPIRHDIVRTGKSILSVSESAILFWNKTIYYTLRFYFLYLSLFAQSTTIFVYGSVVYGPAKYLHYFR